MALCGLLGNCDDTSKFALDLPSISLGLDPVQATKDASTTNARAITQAQTTTTADYNTSLPTQQAATRTAASQVKSSTMVSASTTVSIPASIATESTTALTSETSLVPLSSGAFTSVASLLSTANLVSPVPAPPTLASSASSALSSSDNEALAAKNAHAKSDNGLSLPIGAIVGICIGGIFALVVLSWLLMFCCKKSRKRKDQEAIANWSDVDVAIARSASPLPLLSEKQETGSIRSFRTAGSAVGPNTTIAYTPAPPSNAFRGPTDRTNPPYPYGPSVNFGPPLPHSQPYASQAPYQAPYNG